MNYSIKDIEILTGIKSHTIRIWEKRYGIIQPNRSDGNFRFYGDDEARKLLNISYLNSLGYKISKIAQLSQKQIDEIISISIDQIEFKDESYSKALDIAVMNFDEVSINKVFDLYQKQFGFTSLIEELIYPYLQKIGLLWSKSEITPANEHFISAIIKKKILIESDNLNNIEKIDKAVVLFLPEGEQHELSLLYSNYIFKSSGWKCYYLGCNLPLESLNQFLSTQKVNAAISTPTNHNYLSKEYLNTLQNSTCEKFIISNANVDIGVFSKAVYVGKPEELCSFLKGSGGA